MPPQSRSLSAQRRRYFRSKLRQWFVSNRRCFPWRQLRDPYRILVAEILLQQTDAAKVKQVWGVFVHSFPDVSSLARARHGSVDRFISRIGLNYRTGRLIGLAKMLESRFAGDVPNDRNSLLTLPGVGPYVANAVLASAFGSRAAIVDTNIVRILDRFFGIHSGRSRPRIDPAIWAAAQLLLPRAAAECRAWNYALLDFAALVCRHYRPLCDICPCRRRCSLVSQQNTR